MIQFDTFKNQLSYLPGVKTVKTQNIADSIMYIQGDWFLICRNYCKRRNQTLVIILQILYLGQTICVLFGQCVKT